LIRGWAEKGLALAGGEKDAIRALLLEPPPDTAITLILRCDMKLSNNDIWHLTFEI